MKKSIELLIAIILATGCKGIQVYNEMDSTHIGGAVLNSPGRDYPADPFEDTGLIHDSSFAPFTKWRRICGITFTAFDTIPDKFIEQIAAVLKDMFSKNADGINKDSVLYAQMQNAIEEGYFNAGSYNGIPQKIKERILLQEYAYWAISSYWDIQTEYGPNEREWILTSPEKLENAQPAMVELIIQDVNRIFIPPDDALLNVFN